MSIKNSTSLQLFLAPNWPMTSVDPKEQQQHQQHQQQQLFTNYQRSK